MCTRKRCFDIGNATRNAIVDLIAATRTGDYKTNGNGTIMRLAPVVMMYSGD